MLKNENNQTLEYEKMAYHFAIQENEDYQWIKGMLENNLLPHPESIKNIKNIIDTLETEIDKMTYTIYKQQLKELHQVRYEEEREFLQEQKIPTKKYTYQQLQFDFIRKESA